MELWVHGVELVVSLMMVYLDKFLRRERESYLSRSYAPSLGILVDPSACTGLRIST